MLVLEVPTLGPSCDLKVPRRSGRGAAVGSESSVESTNGAAFTFDDDVAPPPRLRFNAAGTNEVASLLKSRSSGSAETTAAVDTLVVVAIALGDATGFGGSDG